MPIFSRKKITFTAFLAMILVFGIWYFWLQKKDNVMINPPPDQSTNIQAEDQAKSALFEDVEDTTPTCDFGKMADGSIRPLFKALYQDTKLAKAGECGTKQIKNLSYVTKVKFDKLTAADFYRDLLKNGFAAKDNPHYSAAREVLEMSATGIIGESKSELTATFDLKKQEILININ